jgi:hypothetical protein
MNPNGTKIDEGNQVPRLPKNVKFSNSFDNVGQLFLVLFLCYVCKIYKFQPGLYFCSAKVARIPFFLNYHVRCSTLKLCILKSYL